MFVWPTKRKKLGHSKAAVEASGLWLEQLSLNFTISVHTLSCSSSIASSKLNVTFVWKGSAVKFHSCNSMRHFFKRFHTYQAHYQTVSFILSGLCYCSMGGALFSFPLLPPYCEERAKVNAWQPDAKGTAGQGTLQVSDLISFPSGRHASSVWQSVRKQVPMVTLAEYKDLTEKDKKHKSCFISYRYSMLEL